MHSGLHPRMLRLAIVATLALRCDSRLDVIAGAEPQSFATARFIWYGPHDVNSTAPGIYLHATELCDPPAKVQGKIVYTDSESGSQCNIRDKYIRLDDAGAVGYVKPYPYGATPGLATFNHISWSRTANHRQLVLVEVSAADIDYSSWRASSNLVLQITEPHLKVTYNAYTSLYWMAFIRVLLPLFALVTSAKSFKEGHALWASCSELAHTGYLSELRHVALGICCIECPSVALLGLLVALGQYGPTVLIDSIHGFFLTGLTGLSLATTLLLVLLLEERSRVLPNRSVEPSFWNRYRTKIATLFAFFVGCDVLTGAARISGARDRIGPIFYIGSAGVYMSCHFILGCIYFSKARTLRTPLIQYLRERATTFGANDIDALHRREIIGRLAFTLVMNGSFLFLFFATEVYYAWLIYQASTLNVSRPAEYGVVVSLTVFCRIGVSYWHVEAVKINASKPTRSFSSFCLSRPDALCQRTRTAAAVQPEKTNNTSGIQGGNIEGHERSAWSLDPPKIEPHPVASESAIEVPVVQRVLSGTMVGDCSHV